MRHWERLGPEMATVASSSGETGPIVGLSDWGGAKVVVTGSEWAGDGRHCHWTGG